MSRQAHDLLISFSSTSVKALGLAKSLDLDLKYVLLLDNQSTFDLCCNKGFMYRIRKVSHALNMTSNGSGLNEQGNLRNTSSGFGLVRRLSLTSYA
jgi:hypothetical protein